MKISLMFTLIFCCIWLSTESAALSLESPQQGAYTICLRGKNMEQYIDDVVRLRLEAFSEYPYLCEATAEEEYQCVERSYMKVPESLTVLIFDKDRVVGVATGLPLHKANVKIQSSFVNAGYPIDEIFYLGELVLEKGYRGKNLGHKLYQSFENYVRENTACRTIAFCEVERPQNDPLRPSNYISKDSFWLKLGFIKHPELRTQFNWKIIGEEHLSIQPMVFSLKSITKDQLH